MSWQSNWPSMVTPEALDALRAEFADVDRSAIELRERGRELALTLAAAESVVDDEH